MIVAAAAVAALGTAARRHGSRARVLRWMTLLGSAALLSPTLALVVGALVLAGVPMRRLLAARRRDAGDLEDVALAELIGLGLSAGMTFDHAAAAAATVVGGATEAAVVRHLRAPHHEAPEPMGRLFATVRAAAASGAPVLGAVDGYAATRRAEQRTSALVAVRKLPVKLLFPLALLILPGFVLLTVGPVVAGAIERLGL